MNTRFLVALALLVALPAVAQDWALQQLNDSPRHHEWIDVRHGDRTVRCFVAYPEVSRHVPVVILIHENRGLNDWARAMADEFAGAGFIVVAPDLLSGMGPGGGGTASFANDDAARNALGQLPPAQVSADLAAVFTHAGTIPAGNGRIAVVGFCWGGSQAFGMATREPRLAATLVFYGTGPNEASAYATIKSPVYGFYGGADQRVNAAIPASEAAMQAAGARFDPVVYPDAGHAFMRSGGAPDATGPNRTARDAAFERAVAILRAL
jgi:carboxymethylenebutenolidase